MITYKIILNECVVIGRLRKLKTKDYIEDSMMQIWVIV